ncbi:MAG: hypothetical protein PVF65_03270 [Sphingomonadales bacterium]|jgi:hypothetical protein
MLAKELQTASKVSRSAVLQVEVEKTSTMLADAVDTLKERLEEFDQLFDEFAEMIEGEINLDGLEANPENII